MKFQILIVLSFMTSLVAQNDTIFAFRTANNKVVQFLHNETDSIFTYQFISDDKIELEIIDDLKDKDTIFTVDGYYRGGGCRNAHMDWNTVNFSNGNASYTVYYSSGPGEEACEVDPENPEWTTSFGVTVYLEDKEFEIPGVEILGGEVYGWSYFEILPHVRE